MRFPSPIPNRGIIEGKGIELIVIPFVVREINSLIWGNIDTSIRNKYFKTNNKQTESRTSDSQGQLKIFRDLSK